MNGWFCVSCKSLNGRGARRCYSCGVKRDYIPVGDALVPPSQPAQGLRLPTERAAADAPGVVVSSTNGSPAGAFAVASSAAASGLAFDGPGWRQRGRRPRRARIVLMLALTVVVAVITAAGVLSSPEWLRAAPNRPTPAATRSR
jgi:hypothetical protein